MRTLLPLLAVALAVGASACAPASDDSASNHHSPASDDDDDESPGGSDDDSGGPFESSGLETTRVLGGQIGQTGVSVAACDDRIYVAACRALDLLLFTRAPDGSWTEELIDRSGVGPALAADADGRLHLAYERFADSALVYGVRPPGEAWTFRRVGDADGTIDGRPGLAIDGDGAVHLVWRGASCAIAYAANVTGAWTVEILRKDCTAARPRVAVSAGGEVHLSFYSQDGHGDWWDAVAYGRRDADGWTLEGVGLSNAGCDSDIAIDAQGRPVIVFTAAADQGYALCAATRQAAGWTYETIEAAEVPAVAPAIALDGAGHLAAAYVSAADGTLMLAVRSAAGWIKSSLQDGYHQGAYAYDEWQPADPTAAVRVGTDGAVRVASANPYRGALFHATAAGAQSTVEVVDRAGNCSRDLKVVPVPGGGDAAFCVDVARQEIHCARAIDGVWRDNTVFRGLEGSFPRDSGLPDRRVLDAGVNAAGDVQAVFIDQATESVFHLEGGCGAEPTLIWRGWQPRNVSLAFGPDGEPRAAFMTAPYGALATLGRRVHGAWRFVRHALPVASEPTGSIVPLGLRLAVDSLDRAHLLHTAVIYDDWFYHSYSLCDLTYADGQWNDSCFDSGYGLCARFDSSDRLQSAYVHYDIEGQYPDYYSAENAVYRLDRGADPQVLDQDGVYAPVALTLNDRDRPDLLLYFSDYGLQWLTNRDEGWTRYMVAAPQGFPTIGGLFPEFGYPADAAIGDDGRPRFVYHAGGAVYFAEFR